MRLLIYLSSLLGVAGLIHAPVARVHSYRLQSKSTSSEVEGNIPALYDYYCDVNKTYQDHHKLKIFDIGSGSTKVLRDTFPNADIISDLKSDGLRLLDNDSFDIITLTHTLHTLSRNGISDVILETARLLRPGGVLFINDASVTKDNNPLTQFLPRNEDLEYRFWITCAPKMLNYAGFVSVRIDKIEKNTLVLSWRTQFESLALKEQDGAFDLYKKSQDDHNIAQKMFASDLTTVFFQMLVAISWGGLLVQLFHRIAELVDGGV